MLTEILQAYSLIGSPARILSVASLTTTCPPCAAEQMRAARCTSIPT